MNELLLSAYTNKVIEQNNELKKQLEAYENMIKELKNRIEYTNFIEVETLEKFKSYLDNLLNILNKVGGSDE